MATATPGVLARAVLLVGLLGALALRWPAVPGGLQDDDYIQSAMLDGDFWLERGPLDLFWFGGKTAGERRALVEHGYHPWWTHPEHRVAMLRPFASGMLALEHVLGLSPQAQHVVGLGCFALCLWTVYRFLRTLLPVWTTVIATLLYALDESHGAPTSWLANRSTLISTALALLALTSYVRVRALGADVRALVPSLVLLALAFVSGEYSYFVLGYIAAFEVTRAAPSPRSALAALSIAASVAVVAALLGYGIAYSGYYISPFRDPGRFAFAAIDRVPALLFDLTLGVPARYVEAGVPLREVLLRRHMIDALTWFNLPNYRSVANVLFLPALYVLYRTTRALARREQALSFLVLGACLALLPAAGALPSPRLTGGSAVGFAALIAALLVYFVSLLRTQRALAIAVIAAIACVHVLMPADRAFAEARYATERSLRARAWALGAEIPNDLPANAQIWLTSASDFSTAAHVPWIRKHAGLPLNAHVHLLSGAARAHDLIRIDDRTLEVQVLASDPGRAFTGTLYRPVDAPFHDGDRVVLPGFTAHILATAAGDPVRIRFTADRSLDDPSLVLLCPEPKGLHRCAMPAIGFVLRLPRAPVPWGDPNMSFAKTVRPL